jgi:Domain of unknown function (DUF4395)
VPSSNTAVEPDRVDVRGPRFAAWVTTAVLVLALIVSAASPPAAAAILGVQAVIFAIGAVGGPRRHPYGRVFASVVAPRLGPVQEREPVAPLKFAQLVGLVFAVIGVAGFAAGAVLVGFLVGLVATAAALVAAFLNAAFGICLGCQLYPLVARFRPTPS